MVQDGIGSGPGGDADLDEIRVHRIRRPELASDIRGAQPGRYLIVFRVVGPDAVVRIERVLHIARDVERLFDS